MKPTVPSLTAREKLRKWLGYACRHQDHHIREISKWTAIAEEEGLAGIPEELQRAHGQAVETRRHATRFIR